jgi:hypothetical protein
LIPFLACGVPDDGAPGAEAPASAAEAPLAAPYTLQASGGGSGTGASVLSDSSAAGGSALLLHSTGGAATFTVSSSIPTGAYTVVLRARAHYYLEWPRVSVQVKGQPRDERTITSTTYTSLPLGDQLLHPGDTFVITFLNDAYGGSSSTDRNAIVDELWLTPVVYSGPLVISQGGTYTGNWESLDATVPAVQVKTSEPVIIDNANIRARGHLITANFTRANVTVRNTRGLGLHPNVAGRAKGRFLQAEEFNNLRVEKCDFTSTSGMYFRAWRGTLASETIKILGNRARNIDGRKADASGGYDPAANSYVQFVQFNDVRSIPNVEIAWNEVINEPFVSRVEDNISIYKSSGASSTNPIRIHDNFIQGGYPTDPLTQSYSGGGIMLSDGSSTTVADACGYVHAYGNVVISTTNYGIAISSGHDNLAYNNRIVSSGRLPDGRIPQAQNVGLYVWDLHDNTQYGTFFNNVARDNQINWTKINPSTGTVGENNWWLPDCESGTCTNNQNMTGVATLDDEATEHTNWLARVAQQGIKLGAP